MPRYLHYSAKPLGALRSVAQPALGSALSIFKPHGLWFSVGDGDDDDGWRAWCEAEQFAQGCFGHVTEIVFAESAKLLTLSGCEDIDKFTVEYEGRIDGLSLGRGYVIDWPRVASGYDAIVIAPYVYARRLHEAAHWYYGWDCASGCVWNAEAVAELRPVPSKAMA